MSYADSDVITTVKSFMKLATDLRQRRLEVSVWHDSRLSVLGLNTVLGRSVVHLDEVRISFYQGSVLVQGILKGEVSLYR